MSPPDPVAPLLVTAGDPGGIGPEIVVKAAARLRAGEVVVVGDPRALQRACVVTGLALRVQHWSGMRSGEGAVSVIEVGAGDPVAVGKPTAEGGRRSYAAVAHAAQLCLSGAAAGVVTAPVSKEGWHEAGVPFPGHTEALASISGVHDVAMMLATPELRVVLATVHMSLGEAIRALTIDRVVGVISHAHEAAIQIGVNRPRVAVSGLNPHAGEGGLFGEEEAEIIAPAVAAAQRRGIDASGPWPPDTVFMRAKRGDFDIVVAQYHDQGLIPIKLEGLDRGVNVTLGLPFVRTSVDHGTAYDIAGTGKANEASLLRAIKLAADLVANRTGGTS